MESEMPRRHSNILESLVFCYVILGSILRKYSTQSHILRSMFSTTYEFTVRLRKQAF